MIKWLVSKLMPNDHINSMVMHTGTRIRYQGYDGTITGGAIHVLFDKKPPFIDRDTHKHYKSKTFSLDKDNIEVI